MKSIITRLILLLLVIYLYSCGSTKPISIVKNEGFSEINKGEKAKIEWELKNADYVSIEGINDYLPPAGHIYVSPVVTTKYKLIAYQKNDSLVLYWRVFVRDADTPSGTSDGIVADKISKSYEDSDYLIGYDEESRLPERLKIIRTFYPYGSVNKARVNAIIIDDKGNFVTQCQDNGWSGEHICGSMNFSEEITGVKQEEYISGDYGLDLMILLDNSAPVQNNLNTLFNIKSFLGSLNKADRIAFSYFNHEINTPVPMGPSKSNIEQINDLKLPAANGLNGMYRAIYKSLKDLPAESKNNRALMLITAAFDNASIIYSIADVVKIAKEKKVAVYPIAIGDVFEGYALKYLAEKTGGKFYHIEEDDISLLKNIMTEIHLGNKLYYQFELSVDNSVQNCGEIKSKVMYLLNSARLNDTFKLKSDYSKPYSKYQTIAGFNFKDTLVSPDYYVLIESLAQVMLDNPDESIELIGHSSNESTQEEDLKISMKRAQNVRKLLIDKGIDPSKIRVRYEGAHKPLYFLQRLPWQQFYNRRVEIRWLDPELLPFEIIAQVCSTESEALDLVEQWESNGYKSYYERYLKGQMPIYRVKLWGYDTIENAEQALRELRLKYKTIEFQMQ